MSYEMQDLKKAGRSGRGGQKEIEIEFPRNESSEDELGLPNPASQSKTFIGKSQNYDTSVGVTRLIL